MHIMQLLWSILALLAGGVLGYGFGNVQEAAQRRYELRQQVGKLKSGWSVMPGSMRRVSYLVLALVLVQVACPLMFQNGVQWAVSIGVVLGYGYILYLQMRRRVWGR